MIVYSCGLNLLFYARKSQSFLISVGNSYCYPIESNLNTRNDPRVPIKEHLEELHVTLTAQMISMINNSLGTEKDSGRNKQADLPHGCRWQITEKGEVFFANDLSRKTSWLHPRVESQLLHQKVNQYPTIIYNGARTIIARYSFSTPFAVEIRRRSKISNLLARLRHRIYRSSTHLAHSDCVCLSWFPETQQELNFYHHYSPDLTLFLISSRRLCKQALLFQVWIKWQIRRTAKFPKAFPSSQLCQQLSILIPVIYD